MTPPAAFFNALLRPSVIQILRASGYHCGRPVALDSLTDLAARYLEALCLAAARHAVDNGTSLSPTLVDVRMALEDCGALGVNLGDDDVGGTQDFVDWFAGQRNAEVKRIALTGEEDATDWLMALKQKHSKTGEDSKFQGTLLGRDNEHGEVLVEGGAFDTIHAWSDHTKKTGVMTPPATPAASSPDDADPEDARTPSSGLSSLGDRSIGDDFEFDDHVAGDGDVDMAEGPAAIPNP